MENSVDTVIIGSGISGLSAAHFLSKKNNDFLVLESNNQVGGIIKGKIEKDFIYENGPNTVLLNNEAIKEIIKDCGLWDELQFPKDSSNQNRFVLHKNKLTKIPINPVSFILTPLLSMKSKLKILLEPFMSKHKENTSVFEFISKRFGKEFHDKLIVPFITGIYAGNTKKMSAKHTLKILWNLEQSHGSILKGILKSKSNKKIKSFNFPKGLNQLTSKIALKLIDKIKFNFVVTQILKTELGYEIKSKSSSIFCKNIISTVPAYNLKKIISDEYLVSELDKIIYSPVDVFHFGFLKNNIKNQTQGFGVLTKPSDNKNFLGILFNSRIFDYVSPKDKELFTVLVGGERQKELCELDPQRLKKIVLLELENLISHSGPIVFENHFRWNNGIPQFNLDNEKLIDAIECFEKNNLGIRILGNFFNGVSVSDCIQKSKDIVNSI